MYYYYNLEKHKLFWKEKQVNFLLVKKKKKQKGEKNQKAPL